MSDGIQRPVSVCIVCCQVVAYSVRWPFQDSAPNVLQAAQAGVPIANGNHPATPIKTKPRIEKNRVLVTGGAGFVGSHLCTYLVERGDHVSILLQAASGYDGLQWPLQLWHVVLHSY